MRQAIAFVLLCAAMAAGQAIYNLTPEIGHVYQCRSLKNGSVVDMTGPMECPKGSRLYDIGQSPRSVPAVRKTRKVDAISMMGAKECRERNGIVAAEGLCSNWYEPYWTCSNPDRALLVSENQKKAMCLLVE